MGALRVLSNAAVVIAEGEVFQLSVSKNTATTEDDYMSVIDAKTAALFSAAAEVGGIIAERSAEEQAALRSYGRNLGLAFQLVDDALDYSGEQAKLGKSVGDDFREGKITLPVVLAFRRGGEEERAFWRRTLEGSEPGDGDLERAIAYMQRSGAIDDTIERARHYGADGLRCAGDLPRQPGEIRAAGRGGVLHQPPALTVGREVPEADRVNSQLLWKRLAATNAKSPGKTETWQGPIAQAYGCPWAFETRRACNLPQPRITACRRTAWQKR